MELNWRGRGCDFRNKTNFQGKGRRGGMMGQGLIFTPGLSCVPIPPVRFPAQPTFAPPPVFRGSLGCYTVSSKRSYSKFTRKTSKQKFSTSNETPLPEIDLTQPWVTEEIRNEEKKKEELLDIWRNEKTDGNWAKYKVQKQIVYRIWDKTRADFAASHQSEIIQWGITSVAKRYFCETCDKTFRTDDDMLLHEEEHETCGREGCNFTAHPKIIAKHIKMQHETGLYKRIGKLYTEEDIEKWIEERKKRYPTRKVIEEKKILEQEKLNRGEKMKESNSIFNKSFGNKNKNIRMKNQGEKTHKKSKNRRSRKKKVSFVQTNLEEETLALRKGVPAFSGIRSNNEPVVLEKEDFDISDEEWKIENKPQRTENKFVNSALGLLASCYDSDEENETKESQNISKVEDLPVEDGSDPEEVSSKVPLLEENSNEQRFSSKKIKLGKKDSKVRNRKNSSECNNFQKRSFTLLEELLKNEIRHERNIILQCVHYVVKENFFKR